MNAHIEIFRSPGPIIGGWYFRLVGGNGEIISVSESYTTKWSCKRTARKVAADLNVEIVEKPYRVFR